MPATPKRANRTARPGTRFPSEVVAANVRAFRVLQPDGSQPTLAKAMQGLGHNWVAQTISEVERGGRNVTVDELCSLALVFGVTVSDLLDPHGPDRKPTGLDLGTAQPVPAPLAQLWVRDRAVLALADEGVSWQAQQTVLHPASEALLRAWEHRDDPVEVNPPEQPTKPKQPTKKGHQR